jgi:hypothetical protein
MAGQTPNYDIRFPEMLDPANINAVQFLAEDAEAELGIILDAAVGESATRAGWSQISWVPTSTNITIGNGTLTGSAYHLGQLVWADFQILAHPSSPPTTAWVNNVFPNIIMPAAFPISLSVNPSGHALATAKRASVSPSIINMATELSPSSNAVALLAIEGALRIFNVPSASLGGVVPWSNGDYVSGGLLYITSANVSL